MNPAMSLAPKRLACVAARIVLVTTWTLSVSGASETSPTHSAEDIPSSPIGASADYKDDGLAVTASESGARLHCVFHRLDCEATSEGLWLTSMVTNQPQERFRVIA